VKSPECQKLIEGAARLEAIAGAKNGLYALDKVRRDILNIFKICKFVRLPRLAEISLASIKNRIPMGLSRSFR
jgi:hypothetical protein